MHYVSPLQPTIIPRSEHSVSRKWISPNALRVLYRLKEAGKRAFLVGGGVRDLLLGREPKDFDIVTDATPGEIKRLFRNCRLIGRRFRLAHILFHNEIIEVATFRSNNTTEQTVEEPAIKENVSKEQPGGESTVAASADFSVGIRPRPPRMLKTEDGMILRDNVFGTPEEDALRRDFTVNALFYDIADFSVIDYVDGMKDLRNGLIRIIGDPLVRFTEDPVRMVRAVRFAAMLGFEIEEKTRRAMLELKEKIAQASSARMYEEVLKLFMLGEAEKTYQMLRSMGLFGVIFPQLNEWVDTEAGGFPHIWLGKALEWVDASVQSGKPVPTHVLFALLYGQYVEEKSAELRKSGAYALEALSKAVSLVLSEQAQRVQIPKKIGLAMRDVYWNQSRFEKREGKYPRYFLRRPGFSDAYEYLRFLGTVLEEKKELCRWWEEFVKAHPQPPAPAHQPHKTKGRKPTAESRRKRRRRPKRTQGEAKPK